MVQRLSINRFSLKCNINFGSWMIHSIALLLPGIDISISAPLQKISNIDLNSWQSASSFHIRENMESVADLQDMKISFQPMVRLLLSVCGNTFLHLWKSPLHLPWAFSHLRVLTKWRALSCVVLDSWISLTADCNFTQPKANLLVKPCTRQSLRGSMVRVPLMAITSYLW